jgi:ABC-2 type transport system permease protein
MSTDEGTRLRRAMDLFRSEWIKLWSTPSTWWILLIAFCAAVGIGALAVRADVADWHQMTAAQRASVDQLAEPLWGLLISQLVVAILGALTITGEYSSGLIRTTLTAVPVRGAVLAAKAAVVTVAVAATGTLTTLTAFGVGQAIFATRHVAVSSAHPGVVPGLAAAIGYLIAATLIGLCLGTLLRHTAAAVTVLVALLFLAPELLHGTSPWVSHIANTLPGTAVHRMVSLYPWHGAPSASLSWTVIAVYPTALLAAAALAIRRRDA